MIIVSESSAEATQPVCTGWSMLVHRHTSAARKDTCR